MIGIVPGLALAFMETVVMASIAVKCIETIASVSNSVPASNAVQPSRRLAVNNAALKPDMDGDEVLTEADHAVLQPNVTLWTNALARRLVTDAAGRRVAGVEVERNGETLTVEAPRCGGA